MITLIPNNPNKSIADSDTELTRPSLASLLASIRTPDGKPKYGMIQGKPVIFIEVKTVLNDQSEKFQDKLLCDGLTMNAGDLCVFSCTFCYVPEAMIKLHKDKLDEFNRETGLNLGLDQVVIRRRGFLEVLKKQLLHPDGSRIYDDPNDHRVLYSSTLVDVAGNMELLRETADACILVFENTEWQIRLLSKNPILRLLVTKELIPKKYHHRLILGFSTGTLDDDLAAAIERGTGKVSKRIEALHELQDLGIRTFGMICPSLPYGTQDEYDEFSRAICEALRVERCEHLWAEVINVRGESLTKSVAALRLAGYEEEAERLAAVSGPGSKVAWEEYARMTFEAHQKHVPADKLRFLQYVDERNAGCWSCLRNSGAVLLGSYAEENNLITITTSAPSESLPDLGDDDVRYREELEKIVTRAVNQSLAAAKALHEINTYRDGLLWRKEFRTFTEYCASRWGYQKSQAYRHVQAGGFLARLEKADSPIGEKSGITETHLRPVLENVPEDMQVECWKSVTGNIPEDGKLTAALVKKEAKRFLKKKGVEPKTGKRKKPATKPRSADPDNVRADGKPNIPDVLEMLVRARREDDWSLVDTVIEHLKTTEFATSPTKPNERESALRDEQAEGEALPDAKGCITAEIVAAAMVAVAPPHEQSMGTAKLEKETPVYQRDLAVTEECVRAATAESEIQQDTTDFMSAPLFHAALYPHEEYDKWLAETANSHPMDIRIPNDEGVARISLIRAKQLAFNSSAPSNGHFLQLIIDAENSAKGNRGAFADALFQQHALAADHS